MSLNINSFGYIIIIMSILLIKSFYDVYKDDNDKWWK